MNKKAKWIKSKENTSEICPDFRRSFKLSGKVARAVAYVSARGVYNLL